MVRNETFGPNGQSLSAEVIDLDAGTISFEELSVVKSTRALTSEEITQHTPQEPVKSVDERITKLESENAALRRALIKGAVLTDVALAAEEVSIIKT